MYSCREQEPSSEIEPINRQHASVIITAFNRDDNRSFAHGIDFSGTPLRHKHSTIEVGVGYPDTWLDYSGYALKPGEAYANAAALAASQTSDAARNADSGGTLAERYKRALETLEDTRQHEDKTREERDRLAAEADALQQKLVDTAAKVQGLEAAYAQTQAELDGLNEKVRALESNLSRDRERVLHLIAVLQRLDADKPPALALRP